MTTVKSETKFWPTYGFSDSQTPIRTWTLQNNSKQPEESFLAPNWCGKAANKDLMDVRAHTHARDSAAEVDVVRAGSSRQNLGNWLKWNTAIHSWQVKITKFWETRSIHQRRLSSAGERRIWSALLSEWRSACDPAPTLNPSCFQTTLVYHHKTEFNHQNGLITRDKRQVEIRAAETPALQMIELGSRSARHLKKWVMWQCSSRVFSVVTRMLFWSF